MNVRAVVAEAVGTFILVFVGSLGIATSLTITNGNADILITTLLVPFAFGLGLMAALAVTGHVSGGHYNPAVTLAALLDGRVTWQSALGYVIGQLIGAVWASLVILLVTSMTVVRGSVNAPGPTGAGTGIQELHAFGIELLLTAIFVAVILTITRKLPEFAILVIPLTLLAIHFAAIPLTGASVNPARSLAPAVVSGSYDSLWIYLSAPFFGGVLGWGLYRLLTPPEDEVSVEYEEDLDAELEDDLGELDEELDEELEPA